MSPCVCIFREKRDSEWLILKGEGDQAVFNFSNSFLFSSSHFFTETCQLLYIKSVPFLLTISPCCQGVNQKAQVSFSRFINKTQFCFRHLEPCQSGHDDVSLPRMFTFLMLCSTFPGLKQCPFRAYWSFRSGFKKHALFSVLDATFSKSRIHF